MVKTKYHLGQTVSFNHKLERINLYPVKPGEKRRREWIRISLSSERCGTLVGIRTLCNGDLTYDNLGEDGLVYYLINTKYFQAAIIACDLRRKLIYTTLEEIHATL